MARMRIRRWGVGVFVALSCVNVACVRGGFGYGDAGGEGGAADSASFSATVAVCLDPDNPAPQACEASGPGNALKIDLRNYNLGGGPSAAFLRFDPGPALAGRRVIALTLELHTADTSEANSDQTGEVWQVTPFSAADLTTQAPEKIGTAPVAADGGAVAANAPVTWQLPPSLVVPGSPVTVGIYPVTGDSVLYWDNGGAVPPRLVVQHD